MKWALLGLVFSLRLEAVSVLNLPSDEEIYAQVKAKLAGQTEKIERNIRRAGNQTIEFETFIATDGDMKIAPRVFSDFGTYRNWVLRNINIKPSTGGKYFFQILDVKPDPKDKAVLNGSFLFNLPLYKAELERSFHMEFIPKGNSFAVLGQTLASEDSPVGVAEGYLRAYPAEGLPNTIWLYFRAVAVLRNWLLYEALPEKLLARETGERVQIMLNNYLAEEDRLRSVPPSKEKVAVSPKASTRAQMESKPQRKKGSSSSDTGKRSPPKTK